MGTIISDYFRAAPGSAALGCLPFLLALGIYVYFYTRYDRGVLKRLEKTFLAVVEKSSGLQPGTMDNLQILDEGVLDTATPEFTSAWNNMKVQAEGRYTEGMMPQASSFFRQAALVDVPGSRSQIKTVWGVSAILVLLSLLAPSAFGWVQPMGTHPGAYLIGWMAALGTGILLLLFALLDWRSVNQSLKAYHRFLDAFDAALPAADAMAGPALLLGAVRKNQSAFEKAASEIASLFEKNTAEMVAAFEGDADRIVRSIDEFANGGVLPALTEAMRELVQGHLVPSLAEIRDSIDETLGQVVSRQESGVKELTDRFAERLADTLEVRINLLSQALAGYQDRVEQQNAAYEQRMNEQNDSYEQRMAEQNDSHERRMNEQSELYQRRLDALNPLLADNIQEFTRLTESQNNILSRSDETLTRAAALYHTGAQNEERLNEALEAMTKKISLFEEQGKRFSDEVLAFSDKNLLAQQTFGELVRSMTENLQEALGDAGREIASGINQAVGDNAKAIEDLTLQAQALRLDYETFFTRREESTSRFMEDMDYQVQGILTRMSEDIGIMLKSAVKENGEILSQYKDQTAAMLQSFEEQAMSLNLYAKEINMDISGLSESLESSVSHFNDQIREGIQLSIGDFDRGLAELSERLANTVENIGDAVENLAAVIQTNPPGRP